MTLYAATIFLGAFLLFQLELIAARMILPWFGGSAAVWTTCLLFFQVVLLAGYVYAHAAIRRLTPGAQRAVHAAMLAASLLVLPVVVGESWKPSGAEDPFLRILLLLAAVVGLPFFLLSATSPLVSAWYAAAFPGRSPYRLYALSNLGSMLGLLSYPAVVEPLLAVRVQAKAWSLGYLLFAFLCAATAWRSLAGRGATTETETSAGRGGANPGTGDALPGRGAWLLWGALPACGSILLLAVTNHLTQNVAAIPLLWVVPLSLYMLSFILCFAGLRWYPRTLFLPLLAASLWGMAYVLGDRPVTAPLKLLIPVFAGGLFVCCMVLHGELARLAPAPRHLTAYYLMIALGGAVGGLFVALLAPNLFRRTLELPIGLSACAFLIAGLLARERVGPGGRDAWRKAVAGLAVVCAVALSTFLVRQVEASTRGWRLAVRNFYGALLVGETRGRESPDAARALVHGAVTHGRQFLDPARRREPTAYYDRRSGIGLAIRASRGKRPLRVGVVGLGAGTLAAYGRRGDVYRFYEINPLVVRLAETEFTFLKESPATVEIVLGDARLALEREPAARYDVLAVDAFSGDSIPIHLLTREAFALYFRHLAEDGMLAVHISNKYLDLAPVVRRAAAAMGKEALLVDTEDDPETGAYGATWVLVTGCPGTFSVPPLKGAGKLLTLKETAGLWTDDFSGLFRALK